MHRLAWIGVDWGTSRLRMWAVADDGAVLANKRSEDGAAGLSADDFEPKLMAHIAPWLSARSTTAQPIPVILCGMAGARGAWCEVAYTPIPCVPSACTQSVATRDARIAVHIIAGLSQAEPPDVMRGEETQIAGWLGHHPDYDGLICLPGTHSKWVVVKGGKVRAFRTALTGELFALLKQHSVLRAAMSAAPWCNHAFSEAVREGYAAPFELTTKLFAMRAAYLHGAADGESRLSGILIGAEFAAMGALFQDFFQGLDGETAPVVFIGEAALTAHYRGALEALQAVWPAALPIELLEYRADMASDDASDDTSDDTASDTDAITLAGLAAVYRRLVAA